MRAHRRGEYFWLALASFALGVLCLSCLNCAPSKMGKSLDIGVGVSAAADLYTTRQAIESGRGVEANPFMGQGAWTQGLVKVAGTSAVIGAAFLVETKGQTQLAQVIRLIAIAANTAVAVRNHQVGR